MTETWLGKIYQILAHDDGALPEFVLEQVFKCLKHGIHPVWILQGLLLVTSPRINSETDSQMAETEFRGFPCRKVCRSMPRQRGLSDCQGIRQSRSCRR